MGVIRIHQALLLVALLFFAACNKPTTSAANVSSTSSRSAQSPASYTPRIGIAVSTGSRICMAIHNGNLTNGAALTLIEPAAQKYLPATVAGVAQQACPITRNVDTTVSNYNLDVQGPIDKLIPLIAVLGTQSVTINSNNVARSDLDQTGHPISFRACSADNGIHLTAWAGDPLTSTLLWHGYYYEFGSPAVGGTCTAAEMPAD